MQYGKVVGVDTPVSRIVFGTAFGSFLSGDGDVVPLLDHAVALGITAFDCAKEYGHAQRMLGAWLNGRADRDRLVIETKGCHPHEQNGQVVSRVTREALDNDLAESLDQLHTPYIDIYMLHRDDPNVPAGEIIEWLNVHWRKGEIHAFGGSNWTPARIDEANRYAAQHDLIPFTVSSPNYSLAVEHVNPWMGVDTTLNGDDHADERAWYRVTQMAMFAYSVLGRGFMTGRFHADDRSTAERLLDDAARTGFMFDDNFERLRRAESLASRKGCTVAQIATAWVLHQGMNAFALLSCSSIHTLDSSVAAVDVELTPRECAWLNLEAV